MTTICYCDGVLAFDSRITTGDMVSGSAIKGRKTKKHLIAVAGSWQDAEAFMDWVEAGAVQDDKKKFGKSKFPALSLTRRTR
jgi:20S proteasome alpha/beta subunit